MYTTHASVAVYTCTMGPHILMYTSTEASHCSVHLYKGTSCCSVYHYTGASIVLYTAILGPHIIMYNFTRGLSLLCTPIQGASYTFTLGPPLVHIQTGPHILEYIAASHSNVYLQNRASNSKYTLTSEYDLKQILNAHHKISNYILTQNFFIFLISLLYFTINQ